MPTEILAIGTVDANSGDVVITPGQTLTVALKDAAGPVLPYGVNVEIQLKDDSDEYFRVDTLTAYKPAVVINAAGTYRFSRKNRAGKACGVFSG